MIAISGFDDPVGRETHERGAAPGRATARPGWLAWLAWLEALGVALAPGVAALVLRLRLMAPIDLPDPAFHTAYIVDPADVIARYSAAYATTANLREGARVGFLVPARLAYLAFGAVPGFLVLRYVLALIAIGPVYLLLRRQYGRPAGVAGILVVLSSPVIVTAWGTDYPDSAVVSYAAAAMACLAMPCSPRWRRAWLAAAGVLIVLAVWSHGVAVPLAAATLAGYLGVRLAKDRAGLLADLALLAGVAAAVTGLLVVASAVLLGHGNFISTTWQAYRYMSAPSQVAAWHTTSWRWALKVMYLLVPPAALGALAAAVIRRARSVPVPVLVVGVMAAVQLVVYAWLQFFGTVQTLEEHYFSSTLWPGVCLVLAITIAELARPLSVRPLARWVPAAVLLAVPLAYERDPHVPPFSWAPTGALLAAALIAAALVARGCGRITRPLVAVTATGLALTALAGAALVLTVAPLPVHLALSDDPRPDYASALGGSDATLIDAYRIAAALPVIAGHASYSGELLLTWWPNPSRGFPFPYIEYTGMFYGKINSLRTGPGTFSPSDVRILVRRRPAELLLFDDQSAALFPSALRELAPFRPVLLRTATLRSGSLILYVWLVRLDGFYRGPLT